MNQKSLTMGFITDIAHHLERQSKASLSDSWLKTL